MPQTRDANDAWFALSGPDCAPEERGFSQDPPKERARYWKELARLMFEERRSELFKGLGVDGHKLPRRKATRRDAADGPVLIPHFSASRFSSKMTYRGEPDRAVVAWEKDWRIVVAGHASGRATGTVRDVCGLTPSGITRVVAKARKWWAGQKRHVPWHQQGDTVGMAVPVGARQVTRTFTARHLAPEAPLPKVPPIFSGSPTYTTHQQFEEVFRAAARGQLTPLQSAQTVARLAFLTTPELRDLAKRVGIIPAPSDRVTLLELLRRTLVLRQAEAARLLNRRRAPGGGPPPTTGAGSTPPPSKPKGPPPAVPAPVRSPAPAPTPAPAQPAAPAPAVPTTAPVSAALTVPGGKTGDQVRIGLAAIDSVHKDGSLPTIPVRISATTSSNGSFTRTLSKGSVVAKEIAISRHGDMPAETTAHEVGHFLDYFGIPKNGGGTRHYANDPLFKAWYEAVMKSDAVKDLQAILTGTGPIVVTKEDGTTIKVTRDTTYLRYLLSPVEMWARAYSQFIATKSGNKEILAGIDKVRGNVHYPYRSAQWSDQDFAPIAAEIESMFKTLGWM